MIAVCHLQKSTDRKLSQQIFAEPLIPHARWRAIALLAESFVFQPCFKKERRMCEVSPDVKHLVEFTFVDRDQLVVYQIDEGVAVTMQDYLKEVEDKTWPFHWFSTMQGLDVAVSQDYIEMVRLPCEIGERPHRGRDTGNAFDVVIHFKNRGTQPYKCNVAYPKELTRLLLNLQRGYDENGPFLSFTDHNDELVILDARRLLYVEARTKIIELGWKDVIAEDLAEDQTAKRTGELDRVMSRWKKNTSPS
jgi:hypothetical protein